MLSQADTIKMLASRLDAYEIDLARGAKAEFLRAQLGNLGELYVAMLTRGQIADANNQPGYDVISEAGERISVKTTTQNPARVNFRETTFEHVDRAIVLRLNNSEEIGLSFEILLDAKGEAMRAALGVGLVFYEGTKREAVDLSQLKRVQSVEFKGFRIDQLENSTILIFDENGGKIEPAKPILRLFAADLGVPTLSTTGAEKNTRSMGDGVIKAVKSLSPERP